MPDQGRPKKNYIRYSPEELAAVPTQYQMERELEQVCMEWGLNYSSLMNVEREHKLLKALGPAGYAAQRRLEEAAMRRYND